MVKSGPGGTARGRACALEVGETGEWLEIYGPYHDDYVSVDGAWPFERRRFQMLDRRTGERPQGFPLKDREF